ncbi:MAG TPA: MFS transporter [Rhizomicrobium sp.]|nr:MFS transporter [Rhizomicrobium sp.]
MQKQLWAIAAILFSTALYIMGNGLIGVLIPVRATLAGFSAFTLGIIGSFYFAGFMAGCFLGPRLLARVGHSRTFAVSAGVSAAAILIQSMFVTEAVWILARGAFGAAAACIYMVIESWLNDRASNENRGRIFSAYLTVNFSAIIAGQMLFATGRAQSFTLFSLAAILYALCLVPMGLTRLPQPHAARVPALRPLKFYAVSPVGVAGCIAVGLANSAVWTLAPVYAQGHGLSKGWIAVFMSVFTLGGALVQLPLGRISDRMDRRFIIAGVCLAAAALGVTLALFAGTHRDLILMLIGLFGIVALPLYGLSVAHANDRIPREAFVEASATLLLINSAASVFGPTVAAAIMDHAGTAALFLYTAAIHSAMAAFTIVRIGVKSSAGDIYRDKFEPVPPQSSQLEAALDPRGEEKAA